MCLFCLYCCVCKMVCLQLCRFIISKCLVCNLWCARLRYFKLAIHSHSHTHAHAHIHTDVTAVVAWSFIERKARIVNSFSMKVHIHAHTPSLFTGGREVEVEIEVAAMWSERSFTVCCTNAKCNATLCLQIR